MTPEAVVSLAERILALGEGVAFLVEHMVEACERGQADRAAYYARLAALGQQSGEAARIASHLAGPRKS